MTIGISANKGQTKLITATIPRFICAHTAMDIQLGHVWTKKPGPGKKNENSIYAIYGCFFLGPAEALNWPRLFDRDYHEAQAAAGIYAYRGRGQ